MSQKILPVFKKRPAVLKITPLDILREKIKGMLVNFSYVPGIRLRKDSGNELSYISKKYKKNGVDGKFYINTLKFNRKYNIRGLFETKFYLDKLDDVEGASNNSVNTTDSFDEEMKIIVGAKK